jgi:hypothetical protein
MSGMTDMTERNERDERDVSPSDPAQNRKKPIDVGDIFPALLDRLADRLPPDRVSQYRQFIFADEWMEAADNVMARLVRSKIPVSITERETLREILYAAKNPPRSYYYIANRDEMLASLTLTESKPA